MKFFRDAYESFVYLLTAGWDDAGALAGALGCVIFACIGLAFLLTLLGQLLKAVLQ